MVIVSRKYTVTYYTDKIQKEMKMVLDVKIGDLVLNSFYYKLATSIYENWIYGSGFMLEGIQKEDYHPQKAKQNSELYNFKNFFRPDEPIDYTSYETYVMSLCFNQIVNNFFIVSIIMTS